MTRLPTPDLETDRGTLRSRAFDDIYYSPDDGLAETEHVFINGNDLKQRMRGRTTAQPFVIGELGFGTGLNVLAACKCFDEAGQGSLEIWSVEGFPLSQKAFIEAQASIAQRWPEIAPWAERLAEHYPVPLPGQVQLNLSPNVTLTLAFGDVAECLGNTSFEADAWFLDGFAPSRNPAMWSDDVMTSIAHLTKSGGTAATFSVASGVRTALESAGFTWEKVPGFGRKKQMLRAHLTEKPSRQLSAPWFIRPKTCDVGKVAIIGAGIAGASTAHALVKHKRRPTVFGLGSRAKAASSNPAGLVMPRLDADDTPAARFYRDAFLDAVRRYSSLDDKTFSACGGSIVAEKNREFRIREHGLWPETMFSYEKDSIKIAAAGVLDPGRAVDAMLIGADLIDADAIAIAKTDQGWMIQTADRENHHGPFGALVLATGAVQALWPDAPVTPSLGQLDLFEGPPPKSIVTDGHYVAPFRGQVLTGATYASFEGGAVTASPENTDTNRQAAHALLGQDPGSSISSRVALRATTPDRHPIAGPLYDREAAIAGYRGLSKGLQTDYPPAPYQDSLYALTGLGSRGLVTAPILGAHLAAMIVGGVSPLTSDIAAMVHPGRFLVRDLKRGKISL
ncbi:MAG: tRNA (5-methylaminomethyl-2-thiouridine)(34)-methyltransferase MnmD [Pseudomonadota bacterium]